jgi:hypothetical protein
MEVVLHKLNELSSTCGKCDEKGNKVNRMLLQPFPKIFALCVAWADPNPPQSDIINVLSSIEMEIDISKIFDNNDSSKRYKLRGLISYYLKHYAAYFYSDKEKVWFSFDDVSVHQIGPNWKDVIKKCRMGHAKPVLFFYEEISSSANAESSPVVQSKHRGYIHYRNKRR